MEKKSIPDTRLEIDIGTGEQTWNLSILVDEGSEETDLFGVRGGLVGLWKG